jgi:Domain of unknown function (DUF4303)
MNWFTNLFKRDNSTPHTQEDEFGNSSNSKSGIDWLLFENSLVKLLEADITSFAAQHTDEVFYALALDCNAANCDVLLRANTPTALRDTAMTYSKDRTDQSINAESEELRWGLGDWKYHGINLEPRENWLEYRAALPGIDELHHPEDVEKFLVSSCRALLRIEQGDILRNLKRTADFRIACIDHDESILDSEERINALRVAAS